MLRAGGMGEVWKARAIAALKHPNIATLHDVGDNYLDMEFINGEPIKPPQRHPIATSISPAGKYKPPTAPGYCSRSPEANRKP